MYNNIERSSSFSSKESLEDIIVKQYKESIGKGEKESVRESRSSVVQSPYEQSVAPKNAARSMRTPNVRPMSAKPSLRRRINGVDGGMNFSENDKLNQFNNDDCYSSDFDESGSSNSDNEHHTETKPVKGLSKKGKARPATAQPRSSPYGTSKELSKPLFKRKNVTITCYASKNGSLEEGIRMTAPSVKQLLESATLKLGLNTAARRVFLSNGVEAFRPQDIPRDAVVYISRGEAYIDRYRAFKSSANRNKGFSRSVKPPSAKGLNRLTGKRTHRVVVFYNGKATDSHEIIYDKPSHYTRNDLHSKSKTESIMSTYMSEKKKKSIEEEIKRKHKISLDKFMDSCTKKFGLTSQARVLYDWKGRVISSFEQVEKLDASLGQSVQYGPLWVSKGDEFNPTGSQLYLKNVVSDLRSQLHGAKQGKCDLEFLENGDYDSLSNPNILQLDIDLIEETKQKVDDDIIAFQSLLKKYKSRLKEVNEMVRKHEDAPFNYTQDIGDNSRLLGEHGLRIKIYENGCETSSEVAYLNLRDIKRGAKDPALIKSRFLEALTSWHKPMDPSGPARSRFVKRLFNRDGEEILNVLKIQNDDEVWLSYGDDFKQWFNGVLTLHVERVSAVSANRDDLSSCLVYKEWFNLDDLPPNSDRSSDWRSSDGIPPSYNMKTLDQLDPAARYEAENTPKCNSFSPTDYYLQHKENSSFLLHPQVKVDRKEVRKSLWPSEGQTWMINQNGTIYSRAFPSMALCVNYDCPITVHYKDRTMTEGFYVTLKMKSAVNGEWYFTPEGNICFARDMNLQLTYLDPTSIQQIKEADEQHGQGDAHSVSELNPAHNNDVEPKATIAVLGKFGAQSLLSANQRWALKQESSKNGCQWRHTEVASSLWRKLAYSWPVLPDGQWNRKYKWPMQGCLLPNAPSLTKQRSKAKVESLRLKVYRNGEALSSRFVWIVAPDLSGMEKSKVESLADLEVSMFLEQATALLNLNSAARRLFDKNGKELSSLRSLKRDQAVYVSSGDWWIDPLMTKSEQQRRHLLAKLTHDVGLIKAYCDVRDPKSLVVEAERGLVIGSRLVLRHCELSKLDKENISKGDSRQLIDEEDNRSNSGSEESFPFGSDLRTAHEKAHLRSDKKYQSKKYPWQHETSEDLFNEEQTPTKREKKRPKQRKLDPSTGQKFVFSNGFICSVWDSNLVLGVEAIDLDNISGSVEVILCQKSIDDPAQQWEMTDDGLIRMKCSSRLVLGAAMPAYRPGSDDGLDVEGCLVTVQSAKPHTYGRANQKWSYDPVLKVLCAFQSNIMDKEVTAANLVSVCTSAVIGSEAICQDGYMVDIPSDAPIIICSACAKMIRGRYQLIKSPEKLAFVCASANGRKNGLRLKGTFSCLNGKVDLSTYEADTTLQHWISQLEKLKQETSLRLLNREIQSHVPIQACRVLAMRNGEGRLRAPELIIGTSISGILEQCTQRLCLGTAARRLYTSDGMHILHMEQLVEWATRHYYQAEKDRELTLPGSGEYERGEPEGNVTSPEGQKLEEGSNSREGTPDHTTAEAGTKVTAADISKKLRPSSGRRSSLNKPPPSRPNKQSQEVALSTVLRTPIEVWVSCGENFIRPSTAERLYEASLKAQMNRNADNLALDTEKHTLRHMQGRRFKEMSPRHLKPTTMPDTPILVDGGWLERSKDEATKLEQVHKLEEHLAESRPLVAPPKSKGIDLNRELYAQANRKRVMVYQKGESPHKAAYVWGESISELLADATTRLDMHRSAKSLYDESGNRMTLFEDIERDSLLCVTSGDLLKGRPKHSDVKMKANWARARKQHGPDGTRIKIAQENPQLDLTSVDPFGPPSTSLAIEVPTAGSSATQ